MTKAFFDVFPTLNIEGPLHDLLEQSQVERVSASRQRDSVHVYLFSTRLIGKEEIWQAEKEIKNQLFPKVAVTVTIHERFELSSQYTPENLMAVYRQGIQEELKRYSHVEFMAFKNAVITYPEPEHMLVELEDTVLNRGVEQELVRILEKVLVERCGLRCSVEMCYREPRERKYARDDELKIQLKVNEICKRVYGEKPSGDSERQGTGQTNPEAGQKEQTEGTANVASAASALTISVLNFIVQ